MDFFSSTLMYIALLSAIFHNTENCIFSVSKTTECSTDSAIEISQQASGDEVLIGVQRWTDVNEHIYS